MISVLLVSDIRLYREGVEAALVRHGGVDIVGGAAGLRDALVLAARTRPNVALVDTTMPDSIAFIRALRNAVPEVQAVALTVNEREGEVVACAEAGVSGYVTRESSLDDLVAAISSVVRGEMLCSPRIAATLVRHVATLAATPLAKPAATLTGRELEVVALLEEGLSNKEIAGRLLIEAATVKNHVHNILEKLQVHGRSEAAAEVRARGMSVRMSPPVQARRTRPAATEAP
jgi:two-component system, NarL family, nitrate/nitrite response regulator NarL